jgi:hypothetical protein
MVFHHLSLLGEYCKSGAAFAKISVRIVKLKTISHV